MSAPKKARVAITIDMTPMVDIAFLLLIFFMSTTVFKKPQEVEVKLPASHSIFKVPETGIIAITITKDSDIFMTMEDAFKDYNNGLSEIMPGERIPRGKRYKAEDIPKVIRELQIKRLVNRVVMKCDVETSYGTVESVMETLQKNDLNIVNLLTDLKEDRKPQSATPENAGAPK